MGHSNSDDNIADRAQYQPQDNLSFEISEVLELGVHGHHDRDGYAET